MILLIVLLYLLPQLIERLLFCDLGKMRFRVPPELHCSLLSLLVLLLLLELGALIRGCVSISSSIHLERVRGPLLPLGSFKSKREGAMMMQRVLGGPKNRIPMAQMEPTVFGRPHI